MMFWTQEQSYVMDNVLGTSIVALFLLDLAQLVSHGMAKSIARCLEDSEVIVELYIASWG